MRPELPFGVVNDEEFDRPLQKMGDDKDRSQTVCEHERGDDDHGQKEEISPPHHTDKKHPNCESVEQNDRNVGYGQKDESFWGFYERLSLFYPQKVAGTPKPAQIVSCTVFACLQHVDQRTDRARMIAGEEMRKSVFHVVSSFQWKLESSFLFWIPAFAGMTEVS